MQDHHGWVDAGWSEARRAGDRGARRSFERGFWAMVALLWWAGLVDAAREVAGCAGEVRQVLIAEAMASNHRTLLDEDGDSSDWVELQNLSDDPVSLKGWQLTDAPARAGRWTLGDLVLPPRGRQVIFCSGKDRQVPPEAGPAPRAPDTVPGLAMWFDAGTINPADTNQVVARAGRRFVRRWESRAPLSLSVDQAHEPSQPEWGADVLGGRPAVKFTDSVAGLASQPISGSVFAPAQECTVLVVQNCQNAPGFFGATVLWQSNPTNWLALLAVWANGNFYFDLGNAYLGGRLNYPAPDDFREHWFVLSATRHGEKRAELHLNGHLHVSQPVRTDFDPSGSAPFRVGLQGFTGWIAELLVFHRALESDERASLEAHLGQKYGLAVRRLEWHANFELNSDGEVLQLYTPSGQLADTLVLQRAPTDVAQGRSEDLAVSGLLRQPTPGFANSEVAYQGQALAPGFSHASGFHGGPFTLRLEEAEPDALARYTLDGSEPGPESPVWPGHRCYRQQSGWWPLSYRAGSN